MPHPGSSLWIGFFSSVDVCKRVGRPSIWTNTCTYFNELSDALLRWSTIYWAEQKRKINNLSQRIEPSIHGMKIKIIGNICDLTRLWAYLSAIAIRDLIYLQAFLSAASMGVDPSMWDSSSWSTGKSLPGRISSSFLSHVITRWIMPDAQAFCAALSPPKSPRAVSSPRRILKYCAQHSRAWRMCISNSIFLGI